MKFSYIAQTKRGESKIGIISADSLDEAKKRLLGRDLILISLEPKLEKKESSLLVSIFRFGRVPFMDKLLFVRNLEMMIKAGLPLREAVFEIRNQTNSRKFKKVLSRVLEHLDNGKPLAETLSFHPDVFDDLFINLIKAGEASGTLEENLSYLAQQLEKSHDLKKKIIAAMIYPSLVLGSAFVLVGVLAIFIFPKLIPLFKSFDIVLPLPTRILLWAIELSQNYGIYILGGVIFLVILFVFLSRFKTAKSISHCLILKIPIVGKVSKNVNLAYFSRTLNTLIKSGIPIVEALEITANTLKNSVYKKEMEKIIEKIQRGEQISVHLRTNIKLFPSVFSRMISVGEKTGKLDVSLLYLAEFYEEEVNNATKNLSTILEPLLLIVVGFMVAFIAVSIIMPIYEVTHGLSGLRR